MNSLTQVELHQKKRRQISMDVFRTLFPQWVGIISEGPFFFSCTKFIGKVSNVAKLKVFLGTIHILRRHFFTFVELHQKKTTNFDGCFSDPNPTMG